MFRPVQGEVLITSVRPRDQRPRLTGVTSERTASDHQPERGRRRPRVLALVAVGVLVEVAALTAGAAWSVAAALTGRATSAGVAAFVGVFALGVGAALVAAVRALRRGSRGARGPLATWQLLQAATGLTLLGVADAPAVVPATGVAAVALAAVVLAGVLSPAALRFTAG